MRLFLILLWVMLLPAFTSAADSLQLAGGKSTADICFDIGDAKVVGLVADLLADDVDRVTGLKPVVRNDPGLLSPTAILIGTIGQSKVIDQLIAAGKVDVTEVQDRWEAYVWQTVENPLPGVRRALVIAGSDRRGTAYGAADLSRQIGVSPWYWWADVPPRKQASLQISSDRKVGSSPEVKYRGIFLNDEDFNLRPWASKTFDPQTKNLGPKTYAKIFELMLRLKLNFIWPAMHPGSLEFSTFPGNSQTADDWAIVTGSSHCEPMLRNNVYWPKSSGQWRYDVNRDAIFNYWKESATTHGGYESVWTLGIRGIHDSAMEGPKDLGARVKMVEQTITDQRGLINDLVTKKYGPVAQCFVPYKEVLPLYNAGMKVPDDVTLVWADDNYGYIRRLGTPEERKRPGGSGVYYHLSYWGSPHSYLWVESISPAIMWEELRKAYNNDSKNLWIVNVGDLKPAEVCIDFFSRLAWAPDAWGPDAQEKFLPQFDTEAFGSAAAQVAQLQREYYRLATVRKPELINYAWVDSLSSSSEGAMKQQYQALLDQEKAAAGLVPADSMDAYFETTGYAVRMLGATGLLYLGDKPQANLQKQYIDQQTHLYNDQIAGGKWHRMMSDEMEGLRWPASVGGRNPPTKRATTRPTDENWITVDAASFAHNIQMPGANWRSVSGLGWCARAMTILPVTPDSHWDLDHITSAPCLDYVFQLKSPGSKTIRLHALPTLRLTLGGKLRVAVSVDSASPLAIDVPGGEADNETSKDRRDGVLANRVTMSFDTGPLSAGPHTLKVFAVDPGVVLDQIDFPGD